MWFEGVEPNFRQIINCGQRNFKAFLFCNPSICKKFKSLSNQSEKAGIAIIKQNLVDGDE